MNKIWIPLLVLGTVLLVSTKARADRVGILIKKLKSPTTDSKVKVTSIIILRKYSDPRVVKAFIATLKNKKETPKVRGFAALALGSLRAKSAIKALRKATRDKNSEVKRKAKKALERICPSKLKGKKFYLNLDKVRAKGPKSGYAKRLALRYLLRIASRRRDAVTGWPKCKRPSSRDLRRKRMKGFYLDTTVKVTNLGGKTKVKVSVLFTTFPAQGIKGSAGASAAVSGSASKSTVRTLVNALMDSVKGDIKRFLNSQ